MHNYPVLEVLAAGFALALIFGYVAQRLKLSPIIGYLLAGYLAGPHTPGIVIDMALAFELSEVGVILLMFGVGLHFKLDDLLAVKGVALPGALAQITASAFCGVLASTLLGLPLESGLILGIGLSVASTVVLLRVLETANMVNTPHGHVAIGWLIVEDMFTVLVLVLLPSLAKVMERINSGAPMDLLSTGLTLGMAGLNMVALWIIFLVVGGKVVPWLLTRVVRTRSQELFTLTVLVTAFATAMISARFFHASVALGAFLGGMVLGKTKLSHQAGADLLPLKDAFAVLFFLSVGMLFNPLFFLEKPWLILVSLLIILIIKPLVAMIMVTLLGYTPRTGLTVAFGLAQVGEFSFILASTAKNLKIVPDEVYYVLVICALISITLNPIIFRTLPFVEETLRKCPGLWRLLNARAEDRVAKNNATHLSLTHATSVHDSHKEAERTTGEKDPSRTIIVGYGPAGQSVDAMLRSHSISTTIIEFNLDTVNKLTQNKRWAVFGNASRKEILEAAGIGSAGYLVLTLPQLEPTLMTAAMARHANPEIRILARAHFLTQEIIFRQAGIDDIAFEEEEISKALANLWKTILEKAELEMPGGEDLLHKTSNSS